MAEPTSQRGVIALPSSNFACFCEIILSKMMQLFPLGPERGKKTRTQASSAVLEDNFFAVNWKRIITKKTFKEQKGFSRTLLFCRQFSAKPIFIPSNPPPRFYPTVRRQLANRSCCAVSGCPAASPHSTRHTGWLSPPRPSRTTPLARSASGGSGPPVGSRPHSDCTTKEIGSAFP